MYTTREEQFVAALNLGCFHVIQRLMRHSGGHCLYYTTLLVLHYIVCTTLHCLYYTTLFALRYIVCTTLHCLYYTTLVVLHLSVCTRLHCSYYTLLFVLHCTVCTKNHFFYNTVLYVSHCTVCTTLYSPVTVSPLQGRVLAHSLPHTGSHTLT